MATESAASAAALRSQLAMDRSIASGALSMLGRRESGTADAGEKELSPELRREVEEELAGAQGRIQAAEHRLTALGEDVGISAASEDDDAEVPSTPIETDSSSRSHSFASPSSNGGGSIYVTSPSLGADNFASLILSPKSLPPRPPAQGELARELEDLLRSLGTPARESTSSEGMEIVKSADKAVALMEASPRLAGELELSLSSADELDSLLQPAVACLADQHTPLARASIYRLLRYLSSSSSGTAYFLALREAHKIDYYVVPSLSRLVAAGDTKAEAEREHALRFARAGLTLPGLEKPMQERVGRAIVALAEAGEDKLRLVALETLGELLLRDVTTVSRIGGIRVILTTLLEGPYDLSPLFAGALSSVLDFPTGRSLFRPGVDVEIMLSPFTDGGSFSGSDDRLRNAAKTVLRFTKSWAGLIYLSSNGRLALRSLIESLRSTHGQVREVLLDLFVELLGISRPEWYHSVLTAGRKLAYYRKSAPPPSKSSRPPQDEEENEPKGTGRTGPSSSKSNPGNLLDQYLAVLTLLLVESGLLDTLAKISASRTDTLCARKISFLVGELLQISNRVLPQRFAAHFQALPQLFGLAAAFQETDARLAATFTLSAVDNLNRKRERLLSDASEGHRDRSNSLEDPLKRGQRQVETARIRMGMQIDDASFRNLLLETQVLATKDATKWNTDVLLDLLEGPLLNPRRLDEAMRASKFVRRLLAFFHPFEYGYSDLPRNSNTARYTRILNTALTTLLANPDGVRYLGEDKLLHQIAICFFQLDPHSGVAAMDLMLSKHRMDSTLSPGYFELVGTLSKTTEGVKLLEANHMWTALYRLSELRTREDLVKAMIENLSYAADGHPRVLLSKALTSIYKHIRVFATRFLATLIHSSGQPEEWHMRLLLTQLYDASPEVCEVAVKVLEEACTTLETLEIVVQMRPSLDHLGDIGVPLLFRFMSTSIGVRYLHEIDFIDRELEDWFHYRNFLYVIHVEVLLARALGTDGSPADLGTTTNGGLARSTSGATAIEEFDGTPPPHFYGQLVRTPEGSEILRNSGHFYEFSDFIRDNGLEARDPDVLIKLKATLWAVGHIGNSQEGLAFLEEEEVVQSIVEIAEDSPVFSVRGTALYALSLIASTMEGLEILDELGWEGVVTPMGRAVGLCIPTDINAFLQFDHSRRAPETEETLLPLPHKALEQEVVVALAHLSNHISANKASKTLARVKSRHRALFQSRSLYYRALEMIGSQHYRIAVRRYIIDLFDIPLSPNTVEDIEKAGEDLLASVETGSAQQMQDEIQRQTIMKGWAARDLDLDDDVSSDESIGAAPVNSHEGAIPAVVREPQLVVRHFTL